ncbi:hypothetical protein GIB67_036226 [Kingdonia uniflora]|uniref:WPP domain-containing protein n=1 Tax=Kingdonia uniflora TaxID=39325 RepID=A0A7J7NTZ6_9MAGN|nr:hypothetical protein GIB67_036226 [Kingdonia uniflora]
MAVVRHVCRYAERVTQSSQFRSVELITSDLCTRTTFFEEDGLLSREEAESAKHIEDATFTSRREGEHDSDGSSSALLYAREESSKLMICFSNRSFGVGAARVAAPILAFIKDQLLEIDLSDFIAGRPEAETLEVMNIFSAFDALLESQSSLEELYLVNDGISEEAIQALYELIPSTDRLKRISSVPLQGSVLKGSIALTEALGTCTFLKNLDLRDNLFGVEAGVALSKIIPLHAGLAIAYLSYLNLEDEGATAIATALRQSAPSLKVLEMARNNITAKSASTLAACIATKKCLTKLNLSENELKDVGAFLIGKTLENGLKKFEHRNKGIFLYWYGRLIEVIFAF